MAAETAPHGLHWDAERAPAETMSSVFVACGWLIVNAYPCEEPTKIRFPSRNRIMNEIAKGPLVGESLHKR